MPPTNTPAPEVEMLETSVICPAPEMIATNVRVSEVEPYYDYPRWYDVVVFSFVQAVGLMIVSAICLVAFVYGGLYIIAKFIPFYLTN